jgi:hypothetical protein
MCKHFTDKNYDGDISRNMYIIFIFMLIFIAYFAGEKQIIHLKRMYTYSFKYILSGYDQVYITV